MDASPQPKDPAWDSARRQVGEGMLSILMPAYNLGDSIAENIAHVHRIFSGQIPFEILVIDDGSRDDTRNEIARSAIHFPNVHAVYLYENLGKGAALRRGFEASRGSFVLLLDGDLDLPPHQVSRFFEIMESDDAHIVNGSKRHPESVLNYPWHRRLLSVGYYGLVKLLVGLPIKDTQTGIKLFRREALEWVVPRMLEKRFAFDLELFTIAHQRGYKVAEAPITLDFHGSWGCANLQMVKNTMKDTLAIFYRTRILNYYQNIRPTSLPEPLPLVSVVIACPAPTHYLDECLVAMEHQTYKNFEVIILPDLKSGRSWHNSVREVPTGPLRPAEKRNIGIKEARGDIVAFLDDDTIPQDAWLTQAVAYFGEQKISAVGGPATTPYNDPYMAKLGGKVYESPLVSGGVRYRYRPTRVQEVDDFPSCNLLVRKQDLETLNGFRTDFWPGEDTYLCLEIVKRLNKTIVYDPRVLVYHHRRALFLPHLRQIGRYALHRGYFARHFPATSRRISYMLPSLFAGGVILGGLTCIVVPLLRPVYLAALSIYALITCLAAAHRNPLSWILVWLGIMATHMIYGLRFIQGICSRRMPSQVERFDHPSEAPGDEQEQQP